MVALFDTVADRLGDYFGLVAGDAASGKLLGDGKACRTCGQDSTRRRGSALGDRSIPADFEVKVAGPADDSSFPIRIGSDRNVLPSRRPAERADGQRC